jgi:hypothetical protein
VGSIELGFMKLGFIGKADVSHVCVMINVSDFEDMSDFERRLELVCIGNRFWCFVTLISSVIALSVFLHRINTLGIVWFFNRINVVDDMALQE